MSSSFSGIDEGRSSLGGVLNDLSLQTGISGLLKHTYASILKTHAAASVVRFCLLAVLACASFFVGQTTSRFVLSAIISLLVFVLLDLLLVDRVLEPWLEARTFDKIIAELDQAISMCQRVIDDPVTLAHLAAAYDGYVEKPARE